MLEDEVKRVILEDLKKDWTFLSLYVKNSPIILDAYSRGIISDQDIESVLHISAIESGLKSYKLCMKNSEECEPDHFSPKELAYVIALGKISAKKAKRLKFRHGETPESFVASFLPGGPKAYLQSLREKILSQNKMGYTEYTDDSWGMSVRDLETPNKTNN